MMLRALVLSLLACLLAPAAEQGQISGIVTDNGKSVIAGAKLTATNPETKDTFTASTNPTGAYLLRLPEGTYDLLVEGPAHQAFHQKVYITPGADNTVNVHLAPMVALKSGKR